MATLNLKVTAGADDGYSLSNGTFDNTGVITIGAASSTVYSAFFRFTGVSGLSGATITHAVLRLYKLAQPGAEPTGAWTVRAEAAAAPAAPSSQADHAGRTRTSSGVVWRVPGATGAWYESPNIASVIQELVPLNPSVIQILFDGAVESSIAGVQVAGYEQGASFAAELEIDYTTNTPPTITDPPSVNYGGYTRTGPANSPISVSFEAEDAEETGSDELTVEVRTAASGGGTLVATDDYTSGTSGSISIAHNASGLSEGSNTLYLRVGDGTDWSDDESFTLLVDRSAPTVGAVTQTPNPAVP